MNSVVDEIKGKIDIAELIGGYVRLQKAGRNFKVCCPFHNEKTASLMVSVEKQIWHCFGCGKGGSIFDFIMEIEGVEFGDALKMLAQRAGVELKTIHPDVSKQLNTKRARLFEICNWATRFFQKQLGAGKTGRQMSEYLKKRGLRDNTITDWQIGYAPDQWESLCVFLRNKGYSDKEILEAGLSVRNESKNSYYDRFRNRIMFPIKNSSDIVIGFTGRENPDQPDERMGKYVNTPSTSIYDKSQVLYGLDRAKLEIKKQNACVFVEGQMDVIMAHQAGTINTVAGSGTALTEEQLKIIRRYTDNIILSYDVDKAGDLATKRGVELAMRYEFNIRIIAVPDGKDPADCVRNNPDLWLKTVKEAKSIMDFYVTKAFSSNDIKTVEGKKAVCQMLLPLLKKIKNGVERAHWLQEIALRLKVKEAILTEELNRIKDTEYTGPEENKNTDNRGDNAIKNAPCMEEYAIGLLLACPELKNKCAAGSYALFTNNDLKKILIAIQTGSPKDAIEQLPKETGKRAEYMMFKVEAQKEFSESFDPSFEMDLCLARLAGQRKKEAAQALTTAIREAEVQGDKTQLGKLMKEYNELLKQINAQ